MNRIKLIIVILVISAQTVIPQSKFERFVSYLDNLQTLEEKETVINSFMTYARTKGIPFIEENTANFIYYNPASVVNIAGDFNGWDYSTISMNNVSGTNFFYYWKEFEPDARLDYKFVVNSSQWILDPENPNRVSGGFGPNSELAMPEYVQPWEIKYNP
ncbi:MAG: hypothetical protein KAQ90_01175, partial [Melioribacteraceae bacterium]|nr:hypothetical protein [Melioribacteraceae bacterium]